eukprot:TRINITY_DN6126_c0_g2_i8.p1 TRINITY_DN6126_c0_g2~~TRINITY_DN6126_c0_g2_i8.p1  ORF type:complete len:100 (-),score=7.90 TRINITY_DN6126_c0_g2_i8:52-351(-)
MEVPSLGLILITKQVFLVLERDLLVSKVRDVICQPEDLPGAFPSISSKLRTRFSVTIFEKEFDSEVILEIVQEFSFSPYSALIPLLRAFSLGRVSLSKG